MSTQNKQNNTGPGIWIAIVILFATGLWPIAVGLLIWQILRAGNKGAVRTRHPYDLQREQQAQTKTQQRTQTRSAASRTVSSPIKGHPGLGLIIAGAVVAGIFALGAMGTALTFVESLLYGYFFADELLGVIFCALFMVGGLAMLGVGVGKRRRRERYLNYLAYIGVNKEVSLAHMAAAFDVPVRRLCGDLRKMISDKVLAGYLDLAAGKLVLSEKGYQAPPPKPEQEPKAEPEQPQDDNAILAEIRAVNDAIPDPVMSAKIDRIGEITGKILDYQRRNPGKDSQLRSFLNYYLPTTLKILRSYAQLDAQGVEGENISAAKARIEGMMDKVVEGFENQLDKLFRDSAMDISSDVAVLEQMLEKDGLSGTNQGMTL